MLKRKQFDSVWNGGVTRLGHFLNPENFIFCNFLSICRKVFEYPEFTRVSYVLPNIVRLFLGQLNGPVLIYRIDTVVDHNYVDLVPVQIRRNVDGQKIFGSG